MLDYLSDIMEDSHDFGWSSAKGCHVVLSVKMEEGKTNWSDIDKIDRVRRIHAQMSAQTQNIAASNRKTVGTNLSHVNFTRRALVARNMTTRIMGNCIYMYVLTAMPMVNHTPTLPKIVNVPQKTSSA